MPEIIFSGEMQDYPRLACGYLECIMLWPHDEAMRERAWAATRAEAITQLADQQGAEGPQFEAETVAGLLRFLRTAPSTADMRPAAEAANNHGIVAGTILRRLVLAKQDGRAAKLGTEIKRIADKFKRERGLGEKNIGDVIWPRYRAVSHLWAAHLERRLLGTDPEMPCRSRELSAFAETAELFREIGVILQPTRSRHGTLLKPAEMWRLPPTNTH